MALGLRNWQAEQQAIRQYRRRRRQAAQEIAKWNDPKAVAKRAKEIRRAFPHAAPGVILPLAKSGIDPNSPFLTTLVNTEVQARAAKGNFAKPGEETDGNYQSKAALAKARAEIEAHNKAYGGASGRFALGYIEPSKENVRNLAENKAKGAGQLTGALDYLPVVAPIKATIEGEDPTTILQRAVPGGKVFEDARAAGGEAAKAVPGPVGGALRQVSRGAFLALDTPMSYLNASIRTAASKVEGLVAGDPFEVDPGGFRAAGETALQTQAGQAVKDLVEGRRVDVGGGWFPDPESQTGKAAAREARAQSPYLIGGHAWTPGRFVANTLFSPDTVPFDILSGTVDAAVTIKADPANLIMNPYTDAVRERRIVKPDVIGDVADAKRLVATAREGMTAAEKARNAAARAVEQITSTTTPGLFDSQALDEARAGLASADEALAAARQGFSEARAARTSALETAVQGAGGFGEVHRPWVNRRTTTEWFASPAGSGVLDYHTQTAERLAGLADQVDNAAPGALPDAERAFNAAHSEAVYDSWLRYGKKGPLEFHDQVVRAKDREGVMGVMDDWLGTELREFPEARKFRPNWRPNLDGYRWAQKTPSSQALWLDDPEDAATQADRWLRNAEVPREERAEVFGKIVRAQGEDDWYDAANRMTQIVEDRLVQKYQVPRSYARAATRLFGTSVDDDFRRFGVESVTGQNLDSPLAVVNEAGVVQPSPHLMVEQLSTNIPLPDYKDIRTLTKTYGGTASRWAGIAEKHEALAREARDAANDALRDSNPALADELAEKARKQTRYAKAARRVADGKDAADMIVGGSRIKYEGGNLSTATGWATKGMAVWRKARLFRLAWGIRVVGEEQARLWQFGLDGLFNHPIQALAIALGANPDSRLGQKIAALPAAFEAGADDGITKALAKKLGRKFTDDLGAWRGDAKGVPFVMDDQDFAEALNKPFSALFESADPRGVGQAANAAGSHRFWTTATKGDARWSSAVVDEMIRLRNDPIARAVANAENPQAAKAWLLGEGRASFDQVFRPDRVVRSGPDAMPKAVAEMTAAELDATAGWYVDTICSRLHGISAGNDRVLDAIRTGSLDGTRLTIGKGYDDLVATIDRYAGEGWEGPMHVRAPIERGRGAMASAGHFVDQVMWGLMPRPSNYLSRSPAFRQLYWRRVEELMPFVDAATKVRLLKNAKEQGVPRTILRRMAGTPAAAEGVALGEIDRLAKGYALQTTKDLLYDLSEKGQLWDQLRLIFPFGEAYQEVLSRWAKGIVENPKILRRLEQGVTEARETGIFEKGPYGQEVFTWGPAEWLSDKLIGVPVPISGSVSGLNIAGNGLPGVGPVVQIPLAYLKQQSADFDRWLQTSDTGRTVYDFVFPYGEQLTGNVVQDLGNLALPTWLTRVGNGIFGPEADETYATTVGYIMNYKASTGDYDLHGPKADTEMQRLLDDSADAAKYFVIFRGVLSGTLPTAPIPRWAIRDKDNKLVEQSIIRDKYYARLTEDGPDAAFKWLLNTYGDAAFLVAQGFSTTTGFVPRTEKQWAWVAQNPWSRDLYPETYGLLAPQDPKGEFDFTGYALTEGREREKLTPKERIKLANHRLASYIYDKEAADFGDDPTDEQQAWLDELKVALEKEYPGYNTGAIDFNSTKRRVLELERAMSDPQVAKARPGLVDGLSDYFALRDEALKMQGERGLTSRQISTAKDAEDIRAWLKKYGKKIARERPQFAGVWREVFMRELG